MVQTLRFSQDFDLVSTEEHINYSFQKGDMIEAGLWGC